MYLLNIKRWILNFWLFDSPSTNGINSISCSLSKYRNCHFYHRKFSLKVEENLKIKIRNIFIQRSVFNKTIIPLTLFGYNRVRPGPQKPWKFLNFSFQNSRPRKSLNFTKNSRGPWKVLKFSLLCRFHFVWFRVGIVYWKINNEAWSILFSDHSCWLSRSLMCMVARAWFSSQNLTQISIR